ncbi:MAG: hypothetical protein ACLQLC_12015 [Candidatus Sulfotelmatobacter sp.]
MSKPNFDTSNSERVWWICLLTATALNCGFQIGWFWRFRAREITMDGIAYIGLARHIVDGNFKASLHGYWSPLTSWIIAAAAIGSKNFTLLGRVVTIGSFLLCLPLLYVLVLKLWDSRVAGALAVFWFSTARGIVALAVGMILADFVLTACVLLYFIFLLDALRRNRSSAWMLLGTAHALAFLAKAIAMPWLTIATLLAVLARNVRSPRRMVASLALAFVFPATVWVSWGATLRSKYGVFTTGYQLRANLRTNWNRRLNHRPLGDDLTFADTSSLYDDYMVGDTSWSKLQNFSLPTAQLLPMIVDAEFHNIPRALKETLILLTPGGALGLPLMFVLLIQNRRRYGVEVQFVCIALLSTLALIVAYCMLVFDGRYVIPVLPLLIAIGCPLLLPADKAGGAPPVPAWTWKVLLSLLLASTVFFALYWASPFRTVDRDFEASCYGAANALRSQQPRGTLVSIGDGPYPEQGVGFEAGVYVSYLAGWRLIAMNSALPDSSAQANELAGKVLSSRSDAAVVWGSPADRMYEHIVDELEHAKRSASCRKLVDPAKGEVGTVIQFGERR